MRLPQPPFAGLFALEPMESDDKLMAVSVSTYAVRAKDGRYQLVVVFDGMDSLDCAEGLAETIIELLAEDEPAVIH